MDGIQIILDLIMLAVIGLFFAYFKKKGENLATKEDVEKITEKVESVKAAVGSQQYIHQVRYQNEFNILLELSDKLIELRDAGLGLRPAFDYINPDESDEDRKRDRLATYNKAAKDFYKLYETRKAFYPETIYKGINILHQKVWEEVVHYKSGSKNDPKYWEEAQKNGKAISELADSVIELIRTRAKYWENFEFRKE